MDNSLKFPVPVSELKEYLPHREPMIWISQVEYIKPEGGESLVRLHPKALYMNGTQVRGSSVLEWVAQSYGYVSVCQRIQKDNKGPRSKIKTAYMVAISRLEIDDLFESLLQDVEELRVSVQLLREIGPMQLVYGEVKVPAGHKIAEAEIKLFAN